MLIVFTGANGLSVGRIIKRISPGWIHRMEDVSTSIDAYDREREITNSSMIRSLTKLGDRVNKIVEVRGRVSSSSRFPLAKLDENREKRLKSMVRDR